MTNKLALALACLVLVIAGCGSDDEGGASVTAGDDAAVPAGDGGDDSPATDEGSQRGEVGDPLTDPCSVDLTPVVDEFDVADMGPSHPGQGDHGVQDVKWTPRTCRWMPSEVEVRVAIAGPDDFPEGFVCAEPLGVWDDEVEVIDDLGDQAWFEWDDFQGGTGRLSGCAGELRLDISVAGPRDGTPISEDSARTAAVGLARDLL